MTMATLVVVTTSKCSIRTIEDLGLPPSFFGLLYLLAGHLGRDELRLDLTKDELDKSGESYYVDEKEV